MPTPSHLGKYEITGLLGRGAMGVVYKGFDPGIRRTVALKTIRLELIQDDRPTDKVFARFRNEARAAGRLAHPGIVAVHDYGEDAAVAYIAMEYVEGNSLREYFGRGTRFEERDAISIICQLLEALTHAHEHHVWHRDIKPANLIVMMNGRVKVADFGIACIEPSDLTHTGTVMGSPGYMAPEQYAAAAIDHRADIFAAGVIFYQLLTNTKPFVGTAEQIAYAVCHSEAPKPSVVDPRRRWERYDAILAKALAKKPEDRYQSAEGFRAAILDAHAAPANPAVSEDTVITEILQPAAAADPSSLSRPQRVRPAAVRVNVVQPWEWAMATGAVTLLAAVVWYAILRTEPPPPPAAAAVIPAAPAAPSPPTMAQADQEMVLWELVRRTSNLLQLQAYLESYPDGSFAPIARARLAKLAAGAASARREAESTSENTTAGTTPPAQEHTGAIESARSATCKPIASDREGSVVSAWAGSEPALAPAPPRPEREALFWDSVCNTSDPAELEAYLAKYPNGTFASLARARLAALAAAVAKRPAEAEANLGTAVLTITPTR